MFKNDTVKEYIRPWKLSSLICGLGWLIWGALTLNIPDWDIGISLIMAGLTYLFAPYSFLALLKPRSILSVLLALFLAWFTVDGVYMAYHTVMGNETFRLANFYASARLYFLCGAIWSPKMSLREIIKNSRAVL